jgi:hypothetical protein
MLNASLKRLRENTVCAVALREHRFTGAYADFPRKQGVGAFAARAGASLVASFVHIPKKPLCAAHTNH